MISLLGNEVREWQERWRRRRRKSTNRHEEDMTTCVTASGQCKSPIWPLSIRSSDHGTDKYAHWHTQVCTHTHTHTQSQGSHQYSLLRNLSGSLHLVLITWRGWRLDQSDQRRPMKLSASALIRTNTHIQYGTHLRHTWGTHLITLTLWAVAYQFIVNRKCD